MTLCKYCGEEKATTIIPNPNAWEETEEDWNVCVTCSKVIPKQMFWTMAKTTGNEDMANKFQKEILDICREAGKDVLSMEAKA